ncbi:MAG: glycosyl hydrolase [Alistipes indistinctus]
MSNNLSKEGVVKDLQAMKKAGINRAFIGNIKDGRIPDGPVKVFSDEWWDILHTALKTAGELGIDIGIFNSPGWSQSGGPWVKPEQAMRYSGFVRNPRYGTPTAGSEAAPAERTVSGCQGDRLSGA